ncbi:putative MFS monocarboxylate transporter, partial [Aspergillus saccharolyticus JOP 1030-1]
MLLGSFTGVFCTVGFVNSFGLFEEYYAKVQLAGESQSTIAWIEAVAVFFIFSVSAVSGALLDAIGPRILLLAGSVGSVFSLMMTSLCKEFYQFILAQGILLGISQSLLTCPMVALVSQHIKVIRGASLISRILPGFLADRYGRFNCCFVATFLSGLIALCWTKVTSVAGLVVSSAAYGFSSGAILSLQQACALQLATPQNMGLAVGVVMAAASLSAMAGVLISGELAEKYGYLALSIYSGVSLLVGSLLLLVAKGGSEAGGVWGGLILFLSGGEIGQELAMILN